jgi:uncharacterized protein GlcG (DUF336 family)
MSAPPTTRQLAVIDYDTAARAVAAGVDWAKAKGVALSIAVLDSAGHLVASGRMDGAPFVTIEIARGKAFASVATGGQPGESLAQRYAENPAVWGNASALGYGAPMLPAVGGLPIFADGVLIGAMGASGAPSEIDAAALTHAIASIGAKSVR